jgi:hypothetical protein
VDEGLLERVGRQAGVSNLLDVLSERLSPADLTSLLLAVYRRRAGDLAPAKVLEAFERNRFVGPGLVDASVMSSFDTAWFAVLRELGYAALELSPLSPLGTVAAVTNLDQNKVLTAIRNCEVVADSTNVLALEAAARRRRMLRLDPRSREEVRLCASHRLVRGQHFDRPGMLPHFRLMALTTAGRDGGSFRFEARALTEQVDAHLLLLERAAAAGLVIHEPVVSLTDLSAGSRMAALRQEVVDPLARKHPGVTFGFDDSREAGRRYYREACFFIHATASDGESLLLSDGGFTDWTAQLLNNGKERLLISGMGTERLISRFQAG